MTRNYPKEIDRYFSPNKHVDYFESSDHTSRNRRTNSIDGLSTCISKLNDYSKMYPTVDKTTKVPFVDDFKKILNDRRKSIQTLKEKETKWNPNTDKRIVGDPYRTIFVGKLSYSVNEVDLSEKLSKFGEIEHVRVVRNGTKSRGYAFVVFKNDRDVKDAYENANGVLINGKPILVDIERGRTIKNWIPRFLGGGLGGRQLVRKNERRMAPKSVNEHRDRLQQHPRNSHIRQGRYNYRGRY